MIYGSTWCGQIRPSIEPIKTLTDPADNYMSKSVFSKEVLTDGKLRLEFVPDKGRYLGVVMIRTQNEFIYYYPNEVPQGNDEEQRLQMNEENGFSYEDGKWYYTVSEISDFNDISVQPMFWEDYQQSDEETKNVENVFTDIDRKEWYYNAVQFVYDNAIMNGTSDKTFAPAMILTREQFVTVLYNMEDRPSVEDAESFEDVKKGEYYEKPILWAKKNQITSGISETEFGVGNQIPRQQLVTLLYNYAKIKGYDLTANEDAIRDFPDVKDVAEWAQTPMKWAVTNGVISGKGTTDGKNILDPNGEATRAECAQMIKNLKEKFEARQ